MATRPNGVPGVVRGAYRIAAASGLTTGVAADAPVFSWRWSPAAAADIALGVMAQLQYLRVKAQVVTGFTAAQQVSAYAKIARSFTVVDSGGTALTPAVPLRTSFGASVLADARIAAAVALTPGTRTLDTLAFAFGQANAPAAAATVLNPYFELGYEATSDVRWAPTFAVNEGFVIHNGVLQGAGGTVVFDVEVEWIEFLPSPS